MLCKAGIKDASKFSGLHTLMTAKTLASNALTDNIHEKRVRKYKARPTNERKNEYHKRVSPKVRSGGR